MRGNLFTSDFLERGIRETLAYRELEDAQFAERVDKLQRLFSEFPATTTPNEPETEARLIYPIADIVGWTSRQVQQGFETTRPNVPDALLCLSEEDRRAADHEATQEARIRHTAHDMAAFARDMGHVDDTGEVRPPFVWSETGRRHLRARLDALYFHPL